MRITTRRLRLFAAAAACGLSAGTCLAQAAPPSAGTSLSHPLGGTKAAASAPGNGSRTVGVREIQWDDLVPADWDPLKGLKSLDLNIMNDGDPRASAMLKRMREIWDQAPVNEAMDGVMVRIPGYLVPLEEGKAGVKEFLLVPYFGACIHSPPPPANQIIHVLPKVAVKGLRAMDTVWVSGQLTAFRQDSMMGVSGYRMEAQSVVPYVEKKSR